MRVATLIRSIRVWRSRRECNSVETPSARRVAPIQGVMHVAGPAFAMQAPPGRRRGVVGGGRLDVQPGIRAQVREQRGQHPAPQVRVEGRVDEGQVEGRRGLCMQPRQRVALHDLRGLPALQARDGLAQGRRGVAVVFDEHGLRGAARERFEPERAGAREQVEHAQAGPIDHAQLGAAPAAADDAHAAGVPRGRRRTGASGGGWYHAGHSPRSTRRGRMRWFRRNKSDRKSGSDTTPQPDVERMPPEAEQAEIAPLAPAAPSSFADAVPAPTSADLAPADVASVEPASVEPASVDPASADPVLVPVNAPPPASPGKPGWRERLRGSAFAKSFGGLFSRHPKLDDDLLDEIETALLTADVGVAATTQLLEGLRQRMKRREFANADELLRALRNELIAMLAPVAQPLVIDSNAKPFVLLTVGVNGVGKTTTIGKLARRFRDEGRSLMLAAGDTFRAAAVAQLQVWGDR